MCLPPASSLPRAGRKLEQRRGSGGRRRSSCAENVTLSHSTMPKPNYSSRHHGVCGKPPADRKKRKLPPAGATRRSSQDAHCAPRSAPSSAGPPLLLGPSPDPNPKCGSRNDGWQASGRIAVLRSRQITVTFRRCGSPRAVGCPSVARSARRPSASWSKAEAAERQRRKARIWGHSEHPGEGLRVAPAGATSASSGPQKVYRTPRDADCVGLSVRNGGTSPAGRRCRRRLQKLEKTGSLRAQP